MTQSAFSTCAPDSHPPLRLGSVERYGAIDVTHPPLVLDGDARARHLYAIGATGSGKSTLLLSLMAQDLAAGAGFCLIDPHGDLAADVLAMIPRRRTHEVCVIAPAGAARPVGLNPLSNVPEHAIALQAANITAACRHAWAESWGVRLDYILSRGLQTLIEVNTRVPARPALSLIALGRLFADTSFRSSLLHHVQDPTVLAFWRDEFERWPAAKREEALMPLQNKIGALLSHPDLRVLWGQSHGTVDIGECLSRRQIIIADFSKARLGEENARLAGALLVSAITQAAMERPRDARIPYALYVDEFQNFATTTFEIILSEARKWNLSLTLAHQALSQIPERLQAAILANAGSVVAFRTSFDDARVLAPRLQLGNADQLVELANWTARVSLLEHGVPSEPYALRTDPPLTGHPARAAKVRHESAERFGQPRANVDAAIKRFFTAA
ncbi:MAG: type IV secretory system conjugative DNA transfer family protein [Hyphomicrobiaceae bacterium]